MTLIELSDIERNWLEALTRDSEEGEPISEEEQARVIDAYIAADEGFKDKLDRYAALIDAFAARADMRSGQASRLMDLADRDSRIAKKLKARIHQVMAIRGEKKIETDHHVFTVVNNGGKLPVIVPEEWRRDPATAPEAFHQHKIELDVRAIGDALDAGETVDGCAFGERGTYLRIK